LQRGATDAFATVEGLRGWLTASIEGDWSRLKICPDDDCQWAFVDQSRNRSRRWCSMEVCGNRDKTRTYRARHTT